MEKELIELLEDFKNRIDSKNDTSRQYIPMLREFFLPYLINNYQCQSLKSLFCEEITRNGLINAAIYFVESNENIRSKSRLNFYLSALNSFFNELIFEKYPNPNLQKIHSFLNLIDDICNILKEKNIELREPESYPSINEEQFKFILTYLMNNTPKTIKNKQEHILIKLYLLYGLSPDKVALLMTDDI